MRKFVNGEKVQTPDKSPLAIGALIVNFRSANSPREKNETGTGTLVQTTSELYM
jgi:hypothetical protein